MTSGDHGTKDQEHLDDIEREVDQLRKQKIEPQENRVEGSRDSLPAAKQSSGSASLYVVVVSIVGGFLGIMAAGERALIPDLVNTAAPVMIVIGLLFYAYASNLIQRDESQVAEGHSPALLGNWFVASIALLGLVGACGWLLIDKSRFTLQLALMADIYLIFAIAAHVLAQMKAKLF